MENLLHSELFLLTFTIGTYIAGLWVYHKTRLNLLHPLITSMLVIIVFLSVAKISYGEFKEATHLIEFMLGPSVVALGYLLHQQVEHIRQNWLSILTSILVGSVISIVSVVSIAHWCGASDIVSRSLAAKSVTTPIAIQLTNKLDGIESLTSVVVILVGIFGAIAAPFIFKILKINSPIAKGLALGASAHGVGTAKALEMGALEGAIAGLAIGIMGIATAVTIPIIKFLL